MVHSWPVKYLIRILLSEVLDSCNSPVLFHTLKRLLNTRSQGSQRKEVHTEDHVPLYRALMQPSTPHARNRQRCEGGRGYKGTPEFTKAPMHSLFSARPLYESHQQLENSSASRGAPCVSHLHLHTKISQNTQRLRFRRPCCTTNLPSDYHPQSTRSGKVRSSRFSSSDTNAEMFFFSNM